MRVVQLCEQPGLECESAADTQPAGASVNRAVAADLLPAPAFVQLSAAFYRTGFAECN